MQIITADFESFYDKDYSLSKMTTESYIRSKQFEVIGVATKVDDAPIVWVTGTHKKIKDHLLSLPWDDHLLLAQNTAFDAAILHWRFGIKPVGYLFTCKQVQCVPSLSFPSSSVEFCKLMTYPLLYSNLLGNSSLKNTPANGNNILRLKSSI
jgi:hypothetical protein